MSEKKRPLDPVRPTGMEIIFFYPCPFCERNVPLVAPIRPTMVECDACGGRFPIVPTDERNLRFLKIITAGGKAGVDPDFL